MNNKRINELTKQLFKGSTEAYSQLETLRMIVLNVKINVAKLGDTEEARALSKTGDIIAESLLKLEESTKVVRDISKEIAMLNKE